MDAGVAAGQGIWEGNMSCSRQSCLQVCQKGRDNAMKGRTVTAGVNEQRKQHGANGEVKEGNRVFRAQSHQSGLFFLLFSTLNDYTSAITTRLLCMAGSAPLKATEDFQILQSTYEPLVLCVFSTGDSDLLRRSHNHSSTTFCTAWLSRLNTGSSTSLFAVVHKPLYCSFESTPLHHLT